MKIKLLVIGKTDDKNLGQLIEKYQQRLNHYVNFEIEIIPDIKNVKNLNQLQIVLSLSQILLKRDIVMP